MKKTMRFLSIAALAVMGAIMIGCSKENNVPQQGNVVKLTATVGLDGGATKALTSDGVKTFAEGDQIAVVYKNTSSETVKAVSDALAPGDITGGGKTANFTVTLTDPDNTQNVTYIYPAAMANADGSINYDALNSQDGLLTSLASNLDLATYTGAWSGTSLPTATLDNQLAILAITLKNSDGSSPINNTITGLKLSAGADSYNVTRSASSDPIYVAIRPTTSDIKITATGGSLLCIKTLSGKTYAANNGYNVIWRMETVSFFTINGSGTKVLFAPGNLQATYNGSAWSWAFAANQWDYIGNAAANTSISGNGTVSANGTVDLFGWVGASSIWTGAAQYGISNSTSTGSNDNYGSGSGEALKSDWGNTISDGYTWRTLTNDEWSYVFFSRSGSRVDNTNSTRYTHATINTDGTPVKGIILFPDGLEFASSEATTWGNKNGSSNFTTRCTEAQWTALAAKGCVFLPVAGWRNGASVSDAGSYGYYYSSTSYGMTKAYFLMFGNSLPGMNTNLGRNYGHSVRLVRVVWP